MHILQTWPSLVALTLVAVVSTACGGKNGGDPTPSPSVLFVAPVDGAVFGPSDDVDEATAGVQIAVALDGELPDGTTVSLQNGDAVAFTWTVSGGMEAWPTAEALVTLAPGANALTAVATNDVGETLADASAAIRLEGVVVPNAEIQIDEPLSGDRINPAADTNAALEGIQISVLATLTDVPASSVVTLFVDDVQLAQTAASATVSFSDVTVELGERQLRVSTEVDGVVISDEVTINVVDSPIDDCTVTIEPAAQAEGCDITSASVDADAELEGFQFAITVASSCATATVFVDGVEGDVLDTSAGTATAVITVGDGVVEVFARTTSEAGTTFDSAITSYAVDTTPPVLEVTATEDLVIAPSDDEDLGLEGLQYTLSGTSDLDAGATVVVTVDGVEAATGEVGADGTWSATATFTSNADVQIQASAVDACGNTTLTVSALWQVFATAPELFIDSPLDGALLGAVDDAAPEVPGPQVVFALRGALAEGTSVRVACRPVAASELPFVEVATGAFESDGTALVEATLTEGANACRAEVDVPTQARSLPVSLVADVTTPTARITAPVQDGRYPSTEPVLSVVYENTRSGELLEAFVRVNDDAETALEITDGGTFTTVTVPEGAATVAVRVRDRVGNESAASVGFFVDATPPTLAIGFPTAGATLDETNVAVDGGRLTIAVEATVGDVDAGSELCVSSGALVPTCAVADTSGPMMIENVPVLPGANTLRAVLTDAAGNTAEVLVPFTVGLSLPRIDITSPTDGLRTNDATPLTVVAATDLAAGTDVTLSNNDTEVATAATDASGVATFVDVAIVSGLNRLTATATDIRGTGTSPFVDVTLDQDAPVLAFTAPVDGAVLNRSTPDASGAPGFQQDITVTADAIENGQTATLSVDCGSGITEVNAGFAGGVATFAGVTLANEAECTLSVSTTDAAGNASSESISIRVDVIAPVLRFITPADGDIITSTRDISLDPGVQLNLRVGATNGSAGQTATIAMVSDTRPVALITETSALDADAGDVSIEGYSLDDGVVALTATMQDDAGNAAEPLTIVVTVASEETGARITTPGTGTFVGNSSDRDSLAPGLQADVVATVVGPFNGFTSALCISTGDTVTYPTACERPGFRELARADVSLGQVRWPAVTLPEGSVTLTAELALGAGAALRGLNTPTFTVDTEPPTVESLTAIDDANNDGFLNAAEYGGATTRIRATVTGVSLGSNITLFTNNPAARTNLGAGVVGSGNVAAFSAALVDGPHELFVEVRDDAGNLPALVTLDLSVDRDAPTFSFTRPSEGQTLLASNDAALDPGLQYDVRATTDLADGATVDVRTSGGVLGTLSVTGGVASGVLTLPEGSSTLTATVTDAAGNATEDSRSITVDSVGPTVTFVSPAAGTSLTLDEAADLEPATPGRQLDIELAFTNVEAGQSITLVSEPDNTVVATGLTVPVSGTLTTRVSLFQSGPQTLRASTSDASGNPGTGVSGTITVEIDNCGLRFTTIASPLIWNIAADDGDAGNGFTIDLPVLIDDAACFGETVELVVNGGVVDALLIDDGDETFTNVTFADGDAGTLVARIALTGGPTVQTPAVSFVVDLTAPASPAVTPNDDPTTIGISDASPTGGVGTVDFSLNAPDAIGGTFTIEGPGGVLASGTIAGAPTTLSEVALPEGAYALTFTVTDAAGNATATTTDFTVVWTPPTTPVVIATLENPRRGTTTVRFEANINATGYEVRRATAPITSGTFGAATLVETLSPPFTTNGAGEIEVSVPTLSFQRTHHFGVRASIDGGGVTGVGSDDVFVGLTGFSVLGTDLSGASDIAGLGDINGDGFDDVAFGYQGENVRVVYGAATPDAFAVQSLVAPVDAGFFGFRVHGPGDVNGDGIADLLVTAPLAAPNGQAYLYFGVSPGGGSTQVASVPDVTITYEDPSLSSRRFGISAVDGAGDVLQIGAENLNDIVLGTVSEGAGGSRVLVIAGRTVWPATLALTNDVANNVALDTAQFDGIINSGDFGISVSVLGDVDADGLAEIGVSTYDATTAANGRVDVFLGRSLADFPPVAPALGASDAEFTFIGPVGATRWSRDGITAPGDLTGDGTPDWVVFDANYDALDVFNGANVVSVEVPAPAPSTRYISSTIPGRDVLFGRLVSGIGDVDDDGDIDLVVRSSPNVGSPDLGYLSLSFNDGAGGFSGAQIDLADTDGRAPAGVGDVNGDGYPDVATAVLDPGPSFVFHLLY